MFSEQLTISSYSIDVFAHDMTPGRDRRVLYARPVRVSESGVVGVLYAEKVFPLQLDREKNYVIELNGKSFDFGTSIPIKLSEIYEIPYIEIPDRYHNANVNISWQINPDQFGTFVYLDADDALIEQLVEQLMYQFNYNVISWGVSEKLENFSWYIQLPTGLLLDRFRNILASFVRRASAQSINSIHKITQTQEIVDQPITQASMAESIVSLARDRTEELEQVYDALNAVTEELEELKANSPKAELDKHKTEVRRLKTSDTDKIVSQILLAVFDNLAFPPGTPRLIIEKFKNATMLWQTLSMLNSGVAVPMTRIRGRAGDLGWKEVMKHVSTGSDTRGRVYCRTSPNDHSFDVVLHWKKDSKEQQKFLNSLGKYSYFSDSKTVMV